MRLTKKRRVEANYLHYQNNKNGVETTKLLSEILYKFINLWQYIHVQKIKDNQKCFNFALKPRALLLPHTVLRYFCGRYFCRTQLFLLILISLLHSSHNNNFVVTQPDLKTKCIASIFTNFRILLFSTFLTIFIACFNCLTSLYVLQFL